jgi:hypothetical protein
MDTSEREKALEEVIAWALKAHDACKSDAGRRSYRAVIDHCRWLLNSTQREDS